MRVTAQENRGEKGRSVMPAGAGASLRDRSVSGLSGLSPRAMSMAVTIESPVTEARTEASSHAKHAPSVPKVPCYIKVSRAIVNNKCFNVLTTLLTIYALTGDDFRLIFTNRPSDPIFDYMVCLCIVTFTLECIVSCLGKADYWLSFFFALDVVSTATLILDISVVSLWIASGGDVDGGSNANDMRSGRTARVGAKAGRVVRVLRLVRILKLYKAWYDAVQERKRKERQRQEALNRNEDPEDDWDDADFEESDQKEGKAAELEKESMVGKRLSEVTTRRTICLILAMLLVLPQLQAEVVRQTPVSPEFGSSVVWESFQDYLGGTGDRSTYQQSLLQYMYYHNWFAYADPERFCGGGGEDCPAAFFGHAYWVGIVGQNGTAVSERAVQAQLSEAAVLAWEEANSHNVQDAIYRHGGMPEQAKAILASPWTVDCSRGSYKRLGISLLSEEIPDLVDYVARCPDDLRFQESIKFFPRLLTNQQYQDWHIAFFFDVRPFVRLESVLALFVTLAVLILLISGSLMFSHDANTLVLNPVEKMVARVKAIRANPICAMKMADEEFKAELVAQAKRKRRRENVRGVCQDMGNLATCNLFSRKTDEPMETVILEKSIIKLGSLLALGFGEAGANIISHNMKGDGSAGVDAMVPGTCVECVIGVARISDFSIATEVLQSKIMTFVNQIAEIVHGVATEYHGAPNKNNGDMFLVIWRFESVKDPKAWRLAELSVVAFSKMLGALHRSPRLASYRSHPGLQFRLGKGARVNMSFGLHAGWAIEGAVGSEYKIDASYLSPNVSIATSVEHASRLYGVSLVVAQSAVQLCKPRVREKFRLIDRVIIRGSKEAMELYTVDLDFRSVPVDCADPLQLVWGARNRFKARQFLEQEINCKLRDEYDVARAFEEDPVIVAMRRRYTIEFFQLFNMGYQNYAQGEWQVARRMLACTRVLLGVEDGPSAALLRYMQAPCNFEAPKGWHGVRDISEANQATHG